MQRLLDTIFSFAALVVLAPFLLPVMIILVFSGERGFYIQQRAGYDGNDFGFFKFATIDLSPIN